MHTRDDSALDGHAWAALILRLMVGGYQVVEVDFIANNPGPTLFHCHQQLHMDYGFMTLFDYT